MFLFVLLVVWLAVQMYEVNPSTFFDEPLYSSFTILMRWSETWHLPVSFFFRSGEVPACICLSVPKSPLFFLGYAHHKRCIRFKLCARKDKKKIIMHVKIILVFKLWYLFPFRCKIYWNLLVLFCSHKKKITRNTLR